MSSGCSDVSWRKILKIYRSVQGTVNSSTSSSNNNYISDELLDVLVNYLSYASISFGSITTAARIHFIGPVIAIVCSSFNGDVQILADVNIHGSRVHAHCHFEFVLKRGDKRVCIVEAKKDDIEQGKAQCLLGCESLSDSDNLETVYGFRQIIWNGCF
jgi:hypothetical protein